MDGMSRINNQSPLYH